MKVSLKKVSSLFLIIFLLLSFSICISATTISYEDEANHLKDLGLFLGSEKGFELDRVPNRVEAAIMLIRLLGKENEVKQGGYSHPFTDVPKWAEAYIGYMYEQGLTKGISNVQYGSSQSMDAKSYATFVLRAIGYNDQEGDFTWQTAIDQSVKLGMLSDAEATRINGSQVLFLRDDMVHLSFAALGQSLKGDTKTLAQKLIDEKVFTKEQAIIAGINIGEKSANDKVAMDGSIVVPVTLMDYDNNGWPPQHTLMIDRTLLPESMQSFDKILSGGHDRPVDEIGSYIIKRLEIENIHNEERLTYANAIYDDIKGISISFYDYNAIRFFDKNNQFLGFGLMDDVTEGTAYLKVFPITKMSQLIKPNNYDEIYSYYENLPEITSGYTITYINRTAFLSLDPSKLPSNLQHAAYVGIGSTSQSSYDEDMIIFDMKDTTMYSVESIGSMPVGDETSIDSGDYAVIKIYDTNKKLISVTIVPPSEFITSDPHYVTFEGEVYNNARINKDDFVIKRYINGVIDNSFEGNVSFGTGYGEEGTPGIFTLGPLFKADDTITYEIKSLNPDLRNLTMK